MNTLSSSTLLQNRSPQRHGSAVGRYRWFVCLLLFFATSINYIDRQILSLLKPILDEQLHWTNEEFGIVNAAFQGAYAVGLLSFGWLIDRFGTKAGYAVSIATWSLAAMAHAGAATVKGFTLVRVWLGLGEGGSFPCAVKAVALWFPKRERAFATSLFNSGANVGAIAAPAVIPWIALWGWQMAFIVAGLVGLLWLLLWFPYYDVPEKQKRVSAAELAFIRSDLDDEPEAFAIPWIKLLRYRQVWSFIVAKFLTDPVWMFLLIWLPDFFKKTRGLDVTSSWKHLVTIYSIVTVLSIVGGWFTGYLTRLGWSVNRARKSSMLLYAFCVVPILGATSVGDWLAVILIGFAGAAHQAWSANLFTTVSDMFPKQAIASIIGIGGMAGSIGGMVFPVYAGKLLDRFQAIGNVAGGYKILFTLCAFAYLVAFALQHVLAPRFTMVKMNDSLTSHQKQIQS